MGVENKRLVIKNTEITKEMSEYKLRASSCESRIFAERNKKTTLYHNIKDIKRIKVDTKVKELQITINKLEQTINNYKIEITNLKKIHIEYKKQCDGNLEKCKDENKDKCDKRISKLEFDFQAKIDIHIKKNTKLEQTIITIQGDLGKCKARVIELEMSECNKKLIKLSADIKILNENITNITNINIKCEKKLSTCEHSITIKETKITEYKHKIDLLLIEINKCKIDQDALKKCKSSEITIKETYEKKIIEITVEKDKCKKKNDDCENKISKFTECISTREEITIKIEKECREKRDEDEKQCKREKSELEIEISKLSKKIIT